MTQKEKDKIRNKSYYLRNKDKIDSKSKKLYDEKIMFLKLEKEEVNVKNVDTVKIKKFYNFIILIL